MGRNPDPPPELPQPTPEIPADTIDTEQAARTGAYQESQAAGHGAPDICSRCGRELLDVASLAEQASALRVVVFAAVRFAFQMSGSVQDGGGIQSALLEALMKAEELAVALARSLACRAGTCAGVGEA